MNPSITYSCGGDADNMCWLATTIAFGASVLHSAFSYIESLFVVIFAVRHCTCANTMAGALYGYSPPLYTISILLKLAWFYLESRAKHVHFINQTIQYGSEDIHGLYNRSFFWWINQLFILGFKINLSMESLLHLDRVRIGLNYSQPFLTSRLTNYVGDENPNKEDGYGLIGAFALVYILKSV